MAMHNIGSRVFIALGIGVLHSLFTFFIVVSSIWLCLALWIQQPLGTLFTRIVIILWCLFALSLIGVYVSGHIFSRRADILIYCAAFACSLIWYFSLDARQDRDWDPEVAKQFSYEKKIISFAYIMCAILTGTLMELTMFIGRIVHLISIKLWGSMSLPLIGWDHKLPTPY